MPIVESRQITRDLVQRNRRTLFVFGDNLARTGLGGQAAEMRGEPNAVGIPTKKAPSMDEGAFFTDADLDAVQPIITREFEKLGSHLRAGGRVCLPADGIGTGRAQLKQRAPAIWLLVEWHMAQLRVTAQALLRAKAP